MSGELGGVESGPLGVVLHDVGYSGSGILKRDLAAS
jgi:hypothetical protein